MADRAHYLWPKASTKWPTPLSWRTFRWPYNGGRWLAAIPLRFPASTVPGRLLRFTAGWVWALAVIATVSTFTIVRVSGHALGLAVLRVTRWRWVEPIHQTPTLSNSALPRRRPAIDLDAELAQLLTDPTGGPLDIVDQIATAPPRNPPPHYRPAPRANRHIKQPAEPGPGDPSQNRFALDERGDLLDPAERYRHDITRVEADRAEHHRLLDRIEQIQARELALRQTASAPTQSRPGTVAQRQTTRYRKARLTLALTGLALFSVSYLILFAGWVRWVEARAVERHQTTITQPSGQVEPTP